MAFKIYITSPKIEKHGKATLPNGKMGIQINDFDIGVDQAPTSVSKIANVEEHTPRASLSGTSFAATDTQGSMALLKTFRDNQGGFFDADGKEEVVEVFFVEPAGKAGDKPNKVLTLELKMVQLQSASLNVGSDGKPNFNFSMNYGYLKMQTYRAQGKDRVSASTAGWDGANNRPVK